MKRFCCILLSFLSCLTLPVESGTPNVLFLAVDDMNDWLGCMVASGEAGERKGPRAITPNLDKLAARGTLFSNAHTAGVYCAPSRAAIFSGQFASTTGCYRTANYFTHNPEIEGLQMSFARAGYTTLGAGKLYHHPAGAIDQRGWSNFFLRNPSQRTSGWPLNSWSEETPLPTPFPASVYNRGQEMTGGMFLEWAALPNGKEGEMADTIRVNWAIEQLGKAHEKPFFLAVGLYAPHYPNYCPKKYFDLYDPAEIALPPTREGDLNDLPDKIRRIKTGRSRIVKRLEDLEAWDDAIHGYLACMSYADAMIGRILDALAAGPYADNTIIVFWSDHGYHLGEKGDWGKHTLWERTSNVPFIWAGPGVSEGAVSDVTVSLIDLYPTLVEMCDLPKPAQSLEGKSLAASLARPAAARDRNVFLPHMNAGEYAVINRDWRYISYGEDGEELYDLREDPHEWTNLAGQPQHATTIMELREAAPSTFAEPRENLNARRDLVIEGESFRWQKGAGNTPARSKRKSQPPASGKQPAAQGRKNVLFIVCDDLNTHLSSSGYQKIHTPALSWLASQSMTFHRAFCQYPVCGPSRASLLSGLYPESTGVLNNTADIRGERPGTLSLPRFFKQEGYWTGSTGKVFHSTRHEPGENTWDEFHRFQNDELQVVREARQQFEEEHGSIEERGNRRRWKDLRKKVAGRLDSQTPPGYGRSGLEDAQHKDGKNARQVAKWLQEKTYGEKPFFIACGLQKPHVPFLAPDKYFDLYPLDGISYHPDRPNLWDGLPSSAMSKRFQAFGFQLGKENDALRREYMQAYHACISFIDAQLKLVLDSLVSSGRWEDTIILFTSDHGYHLGDHFLWGKVTLFDIGAKVPFIVRAPGLSKAGTSSQAMVELVDVYPTLADLAGLSLPGHLQGVSLRPLLSHPDRRGRKKFAYSVVTRGSSLGYALRNQRWRYGKWPDGEELYNLSDDPEEKKNLARSPNNAERLQAFREELIRKQREAVSQRTTVSSPAPDKRP